MRNLPRGRPGSRTAVVVDLLAAAVGAQPEERHVSDVDLEVPGVADLRREWVQHGRGHLVNRMTTTTHEMDVLFPGDSVIRRRAVREMGVRDEA